MKVIGIAGLARSGKSTAAAHLVKNHGFVRVRFADPLKAMARALGLNEEEVDGDLKEKPCANLTHGNLKEMLEKVPEAFKALSVVFDMDDDLPHPLLFNRKVSFAAIALAGVITQVIAAGEKNGGGTPRHLMQLIGTEWGRDCIHPDFWISLWQRTAYDVLDHGGKVVCDDVRFENEVATIRKENGVLLKVERAGLKSTSSHISEKFAFSVDHVLPNGGSLDDLFAQVDEAVLERAA